jgi:hypothetical protein
MGRSLGALEAPRRRLLALPAPPPRRVFREKQPPAAPEYPVCPACHQRHEPAPVPLGSEQAAVSWALDLQPAAADLAARPTPMGRGPAVEDGDLRRRAFDPWGRRSG